jgi:hypothetical protein
MTATDPHSVLSFPHPVDEVSARLVATGVVLQAILFLATRWDVLLVTLAYGFVARVLAGPTLRPLGRVVTGVVRPRLPIEPREVPGPPDGPPPLPPMTIIDGRLYQDGGIPLPPYYLG